jgi:hypothetical protein
MEKEGAYDLDGTHGVDRSNDVDVKRDSETSGIPEAHIQHVPIDDSGKTKWDRLWPVIACGAGLFSDGYLNAVRTSYFPHKC